MDAKIREAQLKGLKGMAGFSGSFALAGGTALELYYLKHRFSRDLDLFSPQYDEKEIDALTGIFAKILGKPAKLENEFTLPDRAKVRFYTIVVEGSSFPLKIDFVEDVIFDKPTIKKFDGIPVYDVKHIYLQKIIALTGTQLLRDEVGREIAGGRKEVRDIVDIYFLSKKVEPLHVFLKSLSSQYQRGMMQWYRSFSRQEFKFGFLDLDIYDKELHSSQIILYLEKEIQKFMKEELSEH